jgi:hypothetical protein
LKSHFTLFNYRGLFKSSTELDFSQATQAQLSWTDVLSGIPHASYLGPLFFLICINDLLDACTIDSDLYVYADDVKLFKPVLNILDTSAYIQSNPNNICRWIEKAHLNL